MFYSVELWNLCCALCMSVLCKRYLLESQYFQKFQTHKNSSDSLIEIQAGLISGSTGVTYL